jgi:hypothetical protein
MGTEGNQICTEGDFMLEILQAIVSHPVYFVASTIALLVVVGVVIAVVFTECKEHLRWY